MGRRKEKQTRNRAKIYPVRLNVKITEAQHAKLSALARVAGTDISDRIRAAIDSLEPPQWKTPSHREVDSFDSDHEDIMLQVAANSGSQAEPLGGKVDGSQV